MKEKNQKNIEDLEVEVQKKSEMLYLSCQI